MWVACRDESWPDQPWETIELPALVDGLPIRGRCSNASEAEYAAAALAAPGITGRIPGIIGLR
jgi:hypothetical protein